MADRINHGVLVGVIVAITILGGVLQGTLANRWGTPADMEAAAARVDALKESMKQPFGDWRLVKTEKMTDVVVNTLECRNYINFSCRNDQTGHVVNGFIVLGPPGPISVHTPEVCYSSQDYEKNENRVAAPIEIDGEQNDVLWTLKMRSRKDVERKQLRIYYGWATDSYWTNPEEPRVTYGGEDYLYKIQLATELSLDIDISNTDPCKEFLRAFLPRVREHLFADDEQEQEETAQAGDPMEPAA